MITCGYRKFRPLGLRSESGDECPMRDLLSLIRWMLLGRFRSKASLGAEILALRHKLNVLRRTSPRRAVLSNFDRMIFVCLYRIAPRILDAITIGAGNGYSVASDRL